MVEITVAKVDGSVRAVVRFRDSLDAVSPLERTRQIENAMWRASMAVDEFIEKARTTGSEQPLTVGAAA